MFVGEGLEIIDFFLFMVIEILLMLVCLDWDLLIFVIEMFVRIFVVEFEVFVFIVIGVLVFVFIVVLEIGVVVLVCGVIVIGLGEVGVVVVVVVDGLWMRSFIRFISFVSVFVECCIGDGVVIGIGGVVVSWIMLNIWKLYRFWVVGGLGDVKELCRILVILDVMVFMGFVVLVDECWIMFIRLMIFCVIDIGILFIELWKFW